MFNKDNRNGTKKKDPQTVAKNRRRRRCVWKVIGTIALIFFVTGLICIAAFVYYIHNYLNPTLDIKLENYKLNQTTYMYYLDDNGEKVEQATLSTMGKREWVSIDEMPDNLYNAAIAIEDERFWEHSGVDWKRTFAAVANLFTGSNKSFGASTITQQLVKNLTGNDEISMMRKIEEILRAQNLQKNNSKEEILEYYLNSIYLSDNCYGVGAAAQHYFEKPASELSLAECAAIVGITKYPSKYNPYSHPEYNKERQETILWKMKDLGMITKDQYDEAMAETLNYSERSLEELSGEVQSYFVDQVYYDVINDLVEKKGYTNEFAKSYILGGGLQIITTMKKDVQDSVDAAFCNEDNWAKVRTEAQPQGAITVIDNETGAIVAMYGGRGEKTGSLTLNRATQTYRQPGSTIKPLSVYGPAIEYNVITEGDVYEDTPYEGSWPKNESGGYTGAMTIKKAVALSKNTVAVKVLADLGCDRSFDFMTKKLGFTSLVSSKTSNGQVFTDIALSPLALGGLTNGVSVTQMAAGYATYANGGIYTKPYTYSKVLDSEGNVILENVPEQDVAVSEQTAYIMDDILVNTVQTGTATPAKLGSMTVAGKTGTTSDDKDRWFAGYTPYYTAVVWFGYDTPQEVSVAGTNPALRLWKAAMQPVHEALEPESFTKPSGLTKAAYCVYTGDAPIDGCAADWAFYKSGTTPRQNCDGNHTQLEVETPEVETPEVETPEVETPPTTTSDTENSDITQNGESTGPATIVTPTQTQPESEQTTEVTQ